MAMQKIESLLRQAIGLDCASIGPAALQRAVHERRSLHLLPDAQSYWERLSGSEAELQELIEAVVVPETWFFRDHGAFAAVANLVRSVWLRNRPDRVLRFLSVPCATGEEPYSISMALLQEGVAPENFRIDAVDISARALERARHAVYGHNSFRSGPLQFRDRYFEKVNQTYHLDDSVRAPVRFERGNLLAPDFLPGREQYDAIFCRNVLIYFDGPSRAQAVGVLARLLKPSGALFVAPAETALLNGHGFSPMHWPRAFSFCKSAAAESRPATPIPRAAVVEAKPKADAPIRLSPAHSAPSPRDTQQAVTEIARLADQGRLEEAARACEHHLRAHGYSAQILYLLGLIRDAGGLTDEAVRLYRQALYLQPNHRDALTHLALLLDRQGDAPAAQLLRGRIQRLEQVLANPN